MRNQTAKFLAAAGVGFAGLTCTILPHDPAQARECLSQPVATPAGGHWRYRSDHAQNRKCWYLRGAGEATDTDYSATQSQAADIDPGLNEPAAASAPDQTADLAQPRREPVPAQSAASRMKPALANARAEYQSQSMRSVARRPDPLQPAASSAQPQPGQYWLDQRWSNIAQFDAAPAGDPDPAPTEATQALPEAQRAAQPAQSDAAPPAVQSPAIIPPAVVAPMAAAVPGKSSAPNATSTSTLLGALIAALAVSGLIVGVLLKLGAREPVFKFGRKRRRDIWGDAAKPRDTEPLDASPLAPWMEPMAELPKPRVLDLDLNEFEAHRFEESETDVIELEVSEAESYRFEAYAFEGRPFEVQQFEDLHELESLGGDDHEIADEVIETDEVPINEPPQWVRAARERQLSMQLASLAPAPPADRSEEIEALLMRVQGRSAAG
jgi:hypothetical protein